MKPDGKTLPGALQLEIVLRRPGSLRINPRNARTHSRQQIRQIADSILAFGNISPIALDEAGMIICGHGRLAAANLLGLKLVPTVTVTGLSEAQKRAFAIADNKLIGNAGWDRAILGEEFSDLIDSLEPIGLDLTITGFGLPEIDQIMNDQGVTKPDPDDALPALGLTAITHPGELWQLGHNRILCGDARSEPDLDRLMGGERARMAFIDPPYNVRIAGHVQGRGRIKHREFSFATGEMSNEAYVSFPNAGWRSWPHTLTVKPTILVADAMRDCSMKGEIVLATYLGSVTTVLAAEKTGRRGFGLEYDPLYVDVAIRRWQSYTRADAVHPAAQL